MRRFSKYKQVTAPQRGSRSQTVVREVIEPFLGMRTDVSRHALRPGESGDMLNFFVERGRLRSRPSTSSVTVGTVPALSNDSNPEPALVHGQDNPPWSAWGYNIVAFLPSVTTTSNQSVLGYGFNSGWSNLPQNSAVSLVYTAAANEQYHAINLQFGDLFSGSPAWLASHNNAADTKGLPIVGQWDGWATSITHLPNASSVMSASGAVATFDDRVLIAGETQGGFSVSAKHQRIRWTARGTATDFTSISAGFEDLQAMDGRILALTPLEDLLLIHGDSETWKATPRRDDYAFDFDVIADDVGLDLGHQFLVDTPYGPVWLYNKTLHRFVGHGIRKLSKSLAHEFRDFDQITVAPVYPQRMVYQRRGSTLWVFTAGTGTSATAYALDLTTISQVDAEWDDVLWTKHTIATAHGTWKEGYGSSIGFAADMAKFNVGSYNYRRNVNYLMAGSSGKSTVMESLMWEGGSDDTCEFTTHAIEGKRDSRTGDLYREVGIDYEVIGSDASVWVGVSTDLGASYTTVASNKAMAAGRGHVDIAITPVHARNPIFKIATRTSGSSSTIYIDRLTFEGRAWTGRR